MRSAFWCATRLARSSGTRTPSAVTRADGLEAGNTGQCEKVLQVITGKMSNKVGYDRWVEMIDDQRRQIGKADRCEILGVRYRDG